MLASLFRACEWLEARTGLGTVCRHLLFEDIPVFE